MGNFWRLSAILAAIGLWAGEPAEAQVPGGGAVYTFCYIGTGAATVPSNWVGCPSGGSASPVVVTGNISNASSAVATTSTNVPTVAYNYGFNGTTWDQLQVDASKFLKVNCSAGCASGSTSNASSGVATSSTNLASVSWLYGFNGTTWDQLQVDSNKYLKTAPQATENHIGEVGGNILPITNGMTTSNATVTTGQSIGGIQTLANAVRVSGSLGASGTSGIIQSVVLTFLDAVGSGPLDVYFYNATVTTGSNCQNATAFVLQTADRTNVLGVAHVTDFTSSNTAVVAQANNLAIPFGLASATSLFACVVARASFAITGTANASIKVNVLRN